MKIKLGLLLFTALLVQTVLPQAPAKKLDVTYIATEGYLISSPSKNVLTDALFSYGFNFFDVPSKEVTGAIINSKSPFEKVDLYLITHAHADHVDPNLVNEFLIKRNNVPLVCAMPAIDTLALHLGTAFKRSENIFEITPALNNSIQKEINGIQVEVIALKHLSAFRNGVDFNAAAHNVSYLLDMDGIKVFHSGDIMKNAFDMYFAGGNKWDRKIDVAFLYYGLFENGETDLDFILKTLNPKAIVLMHIPPRKMEEWTKKYGELKTKFANIYLFKQSMEKQTIPVE
jgi:L-ascorbate metabolism protein UlaG (beta-lactamase superfamily)